MDHLKQITSAPSINAFVIKPQMRLLTFINGERSSCGMHLPFQKGIALS